MTAIEKLVEVTLLFLNRHPDLIYVFAILFMGWVWWIIKKMEDMHCVDLPDYRNDTCVPKMYNPPPPPEKCKTAEIKSVMAPLYFRNGSFAGWYDLKENKTAY